MKKIVNGKLYNTETAKCVASWNNGLPVTDFGYCREYLFRKRTGEYFLYGHGGAASKYSVYDHGCRSGGEEINPLTEEQAAKYIELFGIED